MQTFKYPETRNESLRQQRFQQNFISRNFLKSKHTVYFSKTENRIDIKALIESNPTRYGFMKVILKNHLSK